MGYFTAGMGRLVWIEGRLNVARYCTYQFLKKLRSKVHSVSDWDKFSVQQWPSASNQDSGFGLSLTLGGPAKALTWFPKNLLKPLKRTVYKCSPSILRGSARKNGKTPPGWQSCNYYKKCFYRILNKVTDVKVEVKADARAKCLIK